jgi:streptogramin lyase
MRLAKLLPAAALLAAAACSSKKPAQTSNADVTWDTLPSSHAPHATYASLPVIPLTTTTDLKLGGVGATGPVAFGDVRDIDADSTGRILVLDGQANELRAFDAKGAPAGIVMKHGQGPGEIQGANGFQVDASGAIWVNDHARGLVTRFKDGDFKTYPMPIAGFAYRWQGGVTNDGQVWDFWAHAADGPDPAPMSAQKNGPQDSAIRLFLKKLDPKTGVVDSVAIGTETRHGLAYVDPKKGSIGMQLPFTAKRLVAIDPAGAVWTAMSDADRVVKLSAKGDTLLVVDMPGAGPDVSPDERAKAIERLDTMVAQARKRGLATATDAPDWNALLPKRKPVLTSLTVDDRGHLWIERATLSRGSMFDVLTSDGQLLGTIDPDFSPAEGSPITIRGKGFYAVLKDSLDVATVIRAPVPFRPEQLDR